MSSRVRTAIWVLVLFVAVGSMTVAVTADDPPATDDERAYDLKASTLCPVCDGQNVLESNAPVANAIRVQIDDLVDAGRTDAEIREFIDQQYPGADPTPPSNGVGALVWVLPVLGAAVGAAALGLSFRRWRDGRGVEASAEDRALVERMRSQR